jgi:hypothetical protein
VQTITLAVPLLYTVFVIGVCAFLLSRGINHLFVILFAVGAILHAIPTLGIVLLRQAPGGLGANIQWISAFSILGVLGTCVSAGAFLLLAAFLLRSQAPAV